VVRFQIPVPDEPAFALSPDGTQLAYSGSEHLFRRPLDSFAVRDLSGVEACSIPSGRPTAGGSDSRQEESLGR
jgi:hypothetical protein